MWLKFRVYSRKNCQNINCQVWYRLKPVSILPLFEWGWTSSNSQQSRLASVNLLSSSAVQLVIHKQGNKQTTSSSCKHYLQQLISVAHFSHLEEFEHHCSLSDTLWTCACCQLRCLWWFAVIKGPNSFRLLRLNVIEVEHSQPKYMWMLGALSTLWTIRWLALQTRCFWGYYANDKFKSTSTLDWKSRSP